MSSLLKLLTAFFSIILHDPPPPTRRGRFPAIRRHAWLRGGWGWGAPMLSTIHAATQHLPFSSAYCGAAWASFSDLGTFMRVSRRAVGSRLLDCRRDSSRPSRWSRRELSYARAHKSITYMGDVRRTDENNIGGSQWSLRKLKNRKERESS